ncbi:hypothetical protein GLOIN_2v1763802 [Rhizophagus clarus]|uniref:Uncharacterized protein n=1 Tax=Rhizophagus clarus TaxID=94130 RepID=A0A8H3KSD7_9GLOM|nr:hypothetical protein GLOIN_2v1763802 [Rhizophagus clarus]
MFGKGIKLTNSIFKRELEALSSSRLNLLKKNAHLQQELLSKKNNELDMKEGGMNASSANPIITSYLSPIVAHSILILIILTIIWFVVVKRLWNAWKKTEQN